jgi:inner membrane protein
MFFEHRGVFHAGIVPLILVGAAYAYPPMQASLAGLAIGWALHLLADGLTVAGIPLLWPLTKWKMGLPVVRTGGLREGLLSAALVGLCCYQLYWFALPYLPKL